ncbi:MAG: DUF4855 domain-containing protein [Clostridia bacterium]|nr:DUF4855 domain-containing protein [Clostridia bacterium]
MNWYKEFEVEKVPNPPVNPAPVWKEINLISGQPIYGILPHGFMEQQFCTEYFNSRENYNILTDGRFAETPDYLDPAYMHFTRGVGRTVVFRLPYLAAVSRAKIYMLRQDDVAVRLPRRVDVLVSADGEAWQCVCRLRGIACTENAEKHMEEAVFDGVYKAYYVAFRIESVGHVWLDQIEVFGTEYFPAGTKDPVAEDTAAGAEINLVNKYPDYSDFLGVHNVLLSYNCCVPEKVGANHAGLTDEEQYLPYVAYIKDGKIADTLFDAYLFLPYSNYTYSKLYKCAEGWRYYIDNVFAEGYNLDALDKTAARVGEALGMPDYKVTVFFSVLHTNVGYGEHPESFGDLDGDGVEEDMKTFEDRRKAIKWCIDEQIARYKAASPRHCELKAFYWFEEAINYSDKYETDLLSFARDYLHSLGLKLFWIPYFQACGFQDWKENGFDIACMQPNYAFNKAVPTERLYENAAVTKQLGMCVEMEIGGFDAYHVEKFRNYMDCGAETGYMDSVKMYYQGGMPGEFYRAYKCEDPGLHALYDELYLYCKEKYVSRKDR